MSLLSTLDKRLHDLRTRRVKQEKVVADIQKPLTELERLQREEAEALAERARIQAEVEQLQAERGDHLIWLAAVGAVLPQIHAMIDSGNDMVKACQTTLQAVDIGLDASFFSLPQHRLRPVIDQHARRSALVADLEKKITVLGGEL